MFLPIQKGIDYVNSHSAEEIAKTIAPQFKETPLENITKIVERYKAQDTWKKDTVFEKENSVVTKSSYGTLAGSSPASSRIF